MEEVIFLRVELFPFKRVLSTSTTLPLSTTQQLLEGPFASNENQQKSDS